MGTNIFNLIQQYIDPGIIIISSLAISIISIILSIVFIKKENKLKRNYEDFMRGQDSASLEEDIKRIYKDNIDIKEKERKNSSNIKILYEKAEKSHQKLGIVKYDAYQQMGGLMSFALAVLDEKNDGFVLNSIHSTEGCYTYIKEIKNGKCETGLGNEEKVALEKAMEEEEND